MIKLRHYQAGSTPAIVSYLATTKQKNPIVALPTGAGKSYCMADFVQWAVEKKRSVLLLSHVWEILEQNVASIKKYCGIDAAVYSASGGSKKIGQVTVAGIQSAGRKPELFKDFDYVVIDECHRVSYDEKSMYRKLLSNIKCPIIGFTATPFRLGTGNIYGKDEEHLFDDIVHNWTHKEKFMQLVNEGHLCPLVAEGTGFKMNTENVRTTGGDFNLKDLAEKYDRDSVTDTILEEVKIKAKDRKHWLVFAIDIDHADKIAEKLNRDGVKTIAVHSLLEEYGFSREDVISAIKRGEYRCIVNVDILTTGFDFPGIDCICLLRPTKSPVLHVQMLGRGSRTISGKKDCLVLDFAGNVASLGPINDVVIKIKGKGKGGGEPVMKECPKCNLMVHAAVRLCPRCKHKFEFDHGLSRVASADAVMEDGQPVWLNVTDVHYSVNNRIGQPNTMLVLYYCGSKKIVQHVCIEHKGWAGEKAKHWIKVRGGAEVKTAEDAVAQAERYKVPARIRAVKRGKYVEVTDAIFN